MCQKEARVASSFAQTLKPGQRIVSKDGALWRWDGYTVRAGTPTAAAKRLRQRNRLAGLEGQIAQATTKQNAANGRLNEIRTTVERAAAAEKIARAAMDKAYNGLNTSREAHGELSHAIANTQSRVTALTEAAGQIRSDIVDAEQQLATISEALTTLEDPARARGRIEALRIEVGELRRIAADRHWGTDVFMGLIVGGAIGYFDTWGPFDILKFESDSDRGTRNVRGIVRPYAGGGQIGARMALTL